MLSRGCFKNSASPAVNDRVGKIEGQGKDSLGKSTIFSDIEFFSPVITDGAESGSMKFNLLLNGTKKEFIRLSGFDGNPGSGEIVFNENEENQKYDD